MRPRVDQALRAGFDGVYLDTPLAYEELDLAPRAGAQTGTASARAMADLIVRISALRQGSAPGLPGRAAELAGAAQLPGYTEAIDGIGMEELFFQATDQPCTEDYCAENLANTRALRDAGKLVLAVDYATRAGNRPGGLRAVPDRAVRRLRRRPRAGPNQPPPCVLNQHD